MRTTTSSYRWIIGASALAILFMIAVTDRFATATDETKDAQAAVSEVSANDSHSIALFAGGCFWCVESDFDYVPGVIETVSGYAGGITENPTYKTHHQGKHREVVQITYDSTKVSYEELLHTFWRSVDPTDGGGQFCDRGHSYTTAIYTLNPEQQEIASASKAELQESGVLEKPIVTPVEPAGDFWPAEHYHQNYYNENPVRYKLYRSACGRDARVGRVWGSEAHAGISQH